jgi:hypothetical protein
MNSFAFIYKDTKIRMYLLTLLSMAVAFQLSAGTMNSRSATSRDLAKSGSFANVENDDRSFSQSETNKTYWLWETDVKSGQSNATLYNLGCNNNITTLFDQTCTVLVTPDMILEGNLPAEVSDDDFIVRVIGDDANEANEIEDNLVNDAGQFEVVVLPRDPATFPIRDWTGCWGYITVEDKMRPRLINEYDEELFQVKRTLKKQQVLGDIGMAAKQGMLDVSDFACLVENAPGEACDRPYQTVSFQVNRSAVYILELDAEGREDGMLALFREVFNANAPCETLMQQTNEKNEFRTNFQQEVGNQDASLIRMAVPLEAGITYIALVTTDDCLDQPLDRQPFILNLYSEGAGSAVRGFGEQLETTVNRELLCNDVSHIWNNPNSVDLLVGSEGKGAPTFEDCTLARVWFEDEQVVDNSDCDGIYFVRNWFAEDEGGRLSARISQTIRLRRPAMSDIVRPAKTELASFGEMTPANMDDQGRPSPKITGYPYVVSAFGIQELNGSYCNVGASYRDISEFQVCTGVRKIIRQWTLLNWCDIPDQFGENDGMLINYQQVIKVGNVTPLKMTLEPEQTVSTGLFDCLAEWRVPPPQFDRTCNNCRIDVTLHRLTERPLYDQYGRETGDTEVLEELIEQAKVGDVITQLEQGAYYRARYFAVDDCGNQAEPTDLYFNVKDETEPVAVCDGQLNVSVDSKGYARITADDVDEGSWDNCGEVSLFLSRILANATVRDAYLQHVYGLPFSALTRRVVSGPLGETEVWEKTTDRLPVLRNKNGVWYSWWRPDVDIICQDVETQLTVEMLVVDGEGTVEGFWDGRYNGNICWLDINVENKLAPTCLAPTDIQITCDELPYGFDPQDDDQLEEFFGAGLMNDNCTGGTVAQTRKVVTWDCGAGSIVRFFQATSVSGMQSQNVCRQVITVMPTHDYDIKFPKDVSFDCAELQLDTISVVENGCDLLTVNVKDERFEGSGLACYQIQRTYLVMNWCEYDGESPPVEVSRDGDCDGVDGDDDIYVLVRGNDITYLDVDNNENVNPALSSCGNGARGHLTNSLMDRALTSAGYWKYTQYIEVFDRTAPEIRLAGENTFCSYENNCLGDIDLPVAIADFCAGNDIDLQITFVPDSETGLPSRVNLLQENNRRLYEFSMEGTFPFVRMKGSFPIGNHTLEIRAADGCGNQQQKNIDFSVFDCKAPEPVCVSGLSIRLQPVNVPTDVDGDGDEDRAMAVIAASDFKLDGMSECNGPIRRSINIVGQTPDPNRTTLILTCDDRDTLQVEVFVWDSAYNPRAQQPNGTMGGPNYASCRTYVVIQDSQNNLCEEVDPAGIAGLIITEENETLEDVEVNLSGKMSGKKMTPADGLYAFLDLPSGYDYSVTPTKRNDYNNGVSTFDLVMLTRHVLGTQKLDSPYKMIAADVNNSGTITTFDLVHLRKLILGLRTDLPNTASWRFIPADYRFPDPENPWAGGLPEVINFNDVNGMTTQGDFIAIKVGDLNHNAKVNRFSVSNRSLVGMFHLTLEERELRAGETYRIPFTAEDLENIQGYQFTLNFDADALELVDMEYGLAGEEHFGTAFVEEGLITASWNQSQTVSRGPQTELFTLVFRARTDGKLSERLRIGSQYTQAEAYNAQDEMLDVALKFAEGTVSAEAPELYQNQPNPFAERTQIGFYLPKAGEATLTIHDMNGRTLKLIRAHYDRGRHEVELDRSELTNAAGLLYYTLETGTYTETKKMVLID